MSFTQTTQRGVTFHACDLFAAAGGVRHGFGTRLGGVSTGDFAQLNLSFRLDKRENVLENYARFTAALGVEDRGLVFTHQVHQDEVREAKASDVLANLSDPIPYEADGLVTNDPNLCLTAFYADCVPVLLYDPVKKAIAAIHSGWRGTALGIAKKGAEKLTALYGSKPEDILAAIGPGISACCFETREDVPAAFRENWGEEISPFLHPQAEEGRYTVDLKGIIAWQLEGAGLSPQHIDTLPLCTACHPELYWSHRKLGERRGNQGVLIALERP